MHNASDLDHIPLTCSLGRDCQRRAPDDSSVCPSFDRKTTARSSGDVAKQAATRRFRTVSPPPGSPMAGRRPCICESPLYLRA
jgi:hypothetical protein